MSVVDAGAVVPQVHYSLDGRMLHVSTNVAGAKTLRLFDMQGHLLHAESFTGNATTLDLGNVSRGAFVVRLMVGNKPIAVKKINL